jgi:hypothetical protein
VTSERTVHVRVSRSRSKWGRSPLKLLQGMLKRIPEDVRSGIDSKEILQKAGTVALEHIKTAFITKSKGGTDEAGEKWKELHPKTIAYRMSNRGKRERERNPRPSQALTKKQQERWWELYRQGLARFKGDKSSAARRAWAIIKEEGATTLFDKYSGAQVGILRDTDQLLNSFQVRIEGGEIVISTNRKGAGAHHYGVPGKLPQRRLWPEPGRWPQSWWLDVATSIRDSLLESLSEDIERGELS